MIVGFSKLLRFPGVFRTGTTASLSFGRVNAASVLPTMFDAWGSHLKTLLAAVPVAARVPKTRFSPGELG